PGHMRTAPNQDLGMVLPRPLRALSTREATTNPHQSRRASMSRSIPNPETAGVVDPGRLEPAPRTTDYPTSVGHLDHQLLRLIHHSCDHADATQMQTNGHSIGLHQGPFLARRL